MTASHRPPPMTVSAFKLKRAISALLFSMLICLLRNTKLLGNWEKVQMVWFIVASKKKQENNMLLKL